MTDLATDPTTEVEIDAELLEEAQRQISADSPNAAINEALKLLVETARAKRQAAGEALYRMVENGELDFRRLDAVDERSISSIPAPWSASSGSTSTPGGVR